MRSTIITLGTLVAVAMSLVTVTSTAEASPPQATSWTVARSGSHVVVTTVAGSLSATDGRLVLRDSGGRPAESVPLAISIDGLVHPVRATVSAHRAVLVPDLDFRTAVLAPLRHDVDLYAAVQKIKDPITLTAAIGGFVGAATGLVGGCLLGAVAGGVISAPVALLFGMGPVAGCIGGALFLGPAGSMVGTAFAGLGSAIANIAPFMEVLRQPKVVTPPTPKKSVPSKSTPKKPQPATSTHTSR